MLYEVIDLSALPLLCGVIPDEYLQLSDSSTLTAEPRHDAHGHDCRNYTIFLDELIDFPQ